MKMNCRWSFLFLVLTSSATLAFSPVVVVQSTHPRGQHVTIARLQSSTPEDDVPTMDWLTESLVRKEGTDAMMGVRVKDGAQDMADDSPFVEEFDRDGGLGEAPLPSTGVSVADEMYRASSEGFFTELVPVVKGFDDDGVKVAQLVTSSTRGSFEPVRYLVGLSKVDSAKGGTKQEDNTMNDFVMIDVPPYSKELHKKMEEYLEQSNGRLSAILVTCRDNIHYDEAPGVFSIRRADLEKWKKVLPHTATIAYRLDIPRDCRELISQRLDGYGPFALEETPTGNGTAIFSFIETGRPLTYAEWDQDLADDILAGKQKPPDDAVDEKIIDDEDLFSPEAIRFREEGRRILAIYTPGRTFGSVSYVFPEIGLCASGFTIPVEDSRNDENLGLGASGPALDCRGYISTSKAGIARQTESARNLIQNYIDRITVLLPSKGDPVFLDGSTTQRRSWLMDIVKQYEKIGTIYEQLGITNQDDLDI